MSNFPTTKYRALDDDGDALPGAKLYFYETGTTTLYDSYADRARGTANANPVVADANGWFGEIYLDPDQEYRLVLKTSADVTIYTLDEIYASREEDDTTKARLQQIASNPLDYGALGDGVADESGEVQDAIDAATGVVDLLGLVFRCDSQIVLSDGISLINGTLDFTNCSTDDDFILIEGAGLGGATTITGSAATGVVASATGFETGDLGFVVDTGVAWNTALDGMAEMVDIVGIAATTFTFGHNLMGTYSSDPFYKVSTVDNVTLRDLTVIGVDGGASDISVRANFARRLSVSNCNFKGFTVAIQADTCWDLKISNCSFDGGASAIGIKDGTSRVIISGCDFSDAGTVGLGGISVNDGVARAIVVSSCVFDKTAISGTNVASVDIFGCILSNASSISFPGAGLTVQNCKITDAGTSAILGSSTVTYAISEYKKTTIKGCVIDSSGASISINPNAAVGFEPEISITGNTLHGEVVCNCAADVALVNVSDNEIVGLGYVDIDSASGKTIDLIKINNNIINATTYNTSVHAVDLNINAGTINRAIVSGNHITCGKLTGSRYGVYCLGVTVSIVSNNTIENFTDPTYGLCVLEVGIYFSAGSKGIARGNAIGAVSDISIYAINTDDLIISENDCQAVSSADQGIVINTIEKATVSGNTIDSDANAIYMDAVEFANINGNIIESDGEAIFLIDVDRFVISGNNVETDDDHGIYIDTTAGNVTRGTIVGNYINKTSDTAASIMLDGVGANDIAGITVVGNRFFNGANFLEAVSMVAASSASGDNVMESVTGGSVIAGIGAGAFTQSNDITF